MLALKFILEATDKATAPIRRLQKTIDRITAPVRRVQASIVSLGKEAGLGRISAAATELGSRFSGLMGHLRALRSGFFYVTAAAAGLAYPLKRIIDEGSTINDTAAMLGMSARDLQRVSYALTLDGSSMEDAANALRFLQRNAVQAVLGSQEMATWFYRAGISIDFLEKNLKNPKALLYAFADGLERTKTQAQRLELSQQILGRSSGKLVQTLSRGHKEVDRLGDEAEKLGAIMDDATVAAMDDAGDSLTRVGRALKAVTTVIAAAGLPVLQKISRAVIDWAQNNRALIATRAQQFFQELMDRLPAIWDGIVQVTTAIGGIAKAVNSAVQFMGGWSFAIKVLAGLLAGKLALSIGSVLLSLGKLSVALLTTPAGWLALAIGGLVAAGIALVQNWDWVSEKWGAAWGSIKNAAVGALGWINEKIQALLDLIGNVAVKFDSMTPDWVKRFTLPGAAVHMYAENVRAGRAAVPTLRQGAKTNVGGEIRLKIDAPGRVQVQKLRSDNSDVAITVDTGVALVSP